MGGILRPPRIHPPPSVPMPEQVTLKELAPVERLIERIELLIQEDPALEVAETVGALHMIAHRIIAGAYDHD